MSTYTTTPAAPNLVATLWGPLSEIIDPLLDGSGAPVTDPGIPELLGALGEALTAAVRVTRGTPAAAPAPAPARATAVRSTPAARVTTAQVGSVAGEPKPGSLRARIIDYLAANPGQAFTVTQLTHATEATSGGAVGAALNTMAAHGEAVLTSDAPKRYTAPAGATAPAPSAPDADQVDPDEDQDTAPETDADETTAPTPEPEAKASTDADADDEPGSDADQATTPDADDEDAPAPAPQARATRRAKTRR